MNKKKYFFKCIFADIVGFWWPSGGCLSLLQPNDSIWSTCAVSGRLLTGFCWALSNFCTSSPGFLPVGVTARKPMGVQGPRAESDCRLLWMIHQSFPSVFTAVLQMFEWWKMGKQKQHPSKWNETVGLSSGVKFHLLTVFPSGCLSSAVLSLWRRTFVSRCTTTTFWAKTRRLERPSLTWKTASCLSTEPRAASRGPTVCKWTHVPSSVRCCVGGWCSDVVFSSGCLSDLGLTSGGTSWHPDSCWLDCANAETFVNRFMTTTACVSEDYDTRPQTWVSPEWRR